MDIPLISWYYNIIMQMAVCGCDRHTLWNIKAILSSVCVCACVRACVCVCVCVRACAHIDVLLLITIHAYGNSISITQDNHFKNEYGSHMYRSFLEGQYNTWYKYDKIHIIPLLVMVTINVNNQPNNKELSNFINHRRTPEYNSCVD